MWRSLVAVIALSLAIAAFAVPAFAQKRFDLASERCVEAHAENTALIGCWLELVYERLRSDGLDSAFGAFDRLYEQYPLFGTTGCHQHAHRLGDAAYYQYFFAQDLTLDSLEFPQAATACGYGFFHGFIEHYVQDTPRTEFATETCEFMRERWTGEMRDIAMICYHAAGHGFTQASLDSIRQSDRGDVPLLVKEPLRLCGELSVASDEEEEECREGVFNVVNEWMAEGAFGLSIDFEDPFAVCEALPVRDQHACYYEFAQNLLPITGPSPVAAAKFAAPIADEDTRITVFGVMVAGMTQAKVSRDEHPALFNECAQVTDGELHRFCVISLVNGMMEHGDPGDEYRRILLACEFPALSGRGARTLCYRTLAERLSRFYVPSKKQSICKEFPADQSAYCTEAP